MRLGLAILPSLSRRRYADIDTAVHLNQHSHQSIHCISVQINIANPTDVTMVDALQFFCRGTVRQAALLENNDDLVRKLAFDLANIGVGITEVAPNIAAAAYYLYLTHPSVSLAS